MNNEKLPQQQGQEAWNLEAYTAQVKKDFNTFIQTHQEDVRGQDPQLTSALTMCTFLKGYVNSLRGHTEIPWEGKLYVIQKLAATKKRVVSLLESGMGNKGINGLTPEKAQVYHETIGRMDMDEDRRGIDPEIGRRFDAHGLGKGDELGFLTKLLEKGVDPNRRFDTINLRLSDEDEAIAGAALGAIGPYAQGGFIVIGKADMPIASQDSSVASGGIGGVMVNWPYRESAALLAEQYPNVAFATPGHSKAMLEHLIADKKKA